MACGTGYKSEAIDDKERGMGVGDLGLGVRDW